MKQVEFQVSNAWLSLDGYHLNELTIKINPAFKGGELLLGTGLHVQQNQPINSTNSENEIELRAASHADDPRKHLLGMRINSVESSDEKQNPYSFLIDMNAYFTVSNELETTDDVQLATVKSAANTLYCLCREILRANTARGPFPGVLLPAVVFDAKIIEQVRQEKKVLKKPKKK